jgi:myo-inositol 2-dehydrogenase/D-chiro-inositol 1-dehydrogenase
MKPVDFLEGLASGKPAAPTFRDAYATDLVTDAVLKSARTGQWEKAGREVRGGGHDRL